LEINYDKRYKIEYIKIQKKTSEVETIKLSDEVNIDIYPDCKTYVIELLNENEQLQISQNNELIFTDESTAKNTNLINGQIDRLIKTMGNIFIE